MNQKSVGARLWHREKEKAKLEGQTPEEKALWSQIRAELAQTRREAQLPIDANLPDVWLYDSEHLLKELAGMREMILRIPATPDTRSPLQSAIDRVWRIEQDLRVLLHLHREGQRSFAKQSTVDQKPKAKHASKKQSNIVRISA